MTRDFKERNKLTGFRMFFSMFATLLAGVLAQPLISRFDDPRTGHMVMGLLFGIFFALPWIFLFLGTWEIPIEHKEEEKGNFIQNFLSIFDNRSFRIHMAMYICAYGAMDIMMAWLKFYLVGYLNRGGFMTIGLGSIVLTQLVVLPVYIYISNRKGHAFSFKMGLSIWAVAMILFSLHSQSSPQIFLILNCIMIGAGMGAGVVIPYQLLPFVSDVDELITGKNRAGTYSGSMSLIRKMIQGAMVLPALGVLLSLIGYLGPIPEIFTHEQFHEEIIRKIDDPAEIEILKHAYIETSGLLYLSSGADDSIKRDVRLILDRIHYKGVGGGRRKIDFQQSPFTLKWLKRLFIFSPLLFIFSGLFFAFAFKITPVNHSILMNEISRLKKGESKDSVDEKTRTICELLTGKKYADLYRM
jgi:oligogalacturonide transporter